MAIDQKFREFRVNSLPSSGLQAGDRYYLSVGGGKYKTFIVSDSLDLTADAGADFIEKDTMAQMRAITSREIWAIQNGYYKGVRLHGYYAKGDTPAPIEYRLSTTSDSDDGGSVIEVGGVKLEHLFIGRVDLRYYGFSEGDDSNIEIANLVVSKWKHVFLSEGDYEVTLGSGYAGGINMVDDSSFILDEGATLRANPSNLGTTAIFGILNATNVIIDGGNLVGYRDRYLTPTGSYYRERYPTTEYSVGEYLMDQRVGIRITSSGTTQAGRIYRDLSSVSVGDTITDGTVTGVVVSILGEWGIGVTTRSSTNVIIRNINMSEFTGDGVSLGRVGVGTTNTNITLENLYITNCRRQGLSVGTVNSLKAKNLKITKISGTLPMWGIDMETDYDTDVIKNVLIEDVVTEDCEGGGILQDYRLSSAITGAIDVTIINHTSNRDTYGFRASNHSETGPTGVIRYENAVIRESKYPAIDSQSYYNRPDLHIIRPTIIDCNQNNNGSYFGAGIAVRRQVRATPIPYPIRIPLIKIIEPTIVSSDNKMLNGIFVRNYTETNTPFNVFIDSPVISGSSGSKVVYQGSNTIKDKYKNLVFSPTSGTNLFNSLNTYSKLSNENATGTINFTIESMHQGYELEVESVNDQQINLNIASNRPNGYFVFENDSKKYRTLSTTTKGSRCTLVCLDQSEGTWLVKGMYGKFFQGEFQFDSEAIANPVYGDNKRGTANLTDLTAVGRSLFFRSAQTGYDGLGINICHPTSNQYEYQIKSKSYTDATPMFRIKHMGEWGEWKEIPSTVASSSDAAEQASGATPTKAEFDALLSELRDLKTKMRTAGVLDT